MNASSSGNLRVIDEGVKEVMLAMVEATKQGRHDKKRRRRKKETRKEMKQELQMIKVKLDDFFDLIPTKPPATNKLNKRRRQAQALLSDSPGKNEEPACLWLGQWNLNRYLYGKSPSGCWSFGREKR